MSAPKVFISYSHDSPQHKDWVRSLASALRVNGIDAVLDQWDLSPGQDMAAFYLDLRSIPLDLRSICPFVASKYCGATMHPVSFMAQGFR
jgi:hypothetical protein